LLFVLATSYSVFHPLSLHDALPIYLAVAAELSGAVHSDRAGAGRNAARVVGQQRAAIDDRSAGVGATRGGRRGEGQRAGVCRRQDRKSTRLNSSHVSISYAVFCLKK